MFTRPTAAEIESVRAFAAFSKVVVGAGFTFGVISGFVKRNWKVLTPLLFFLLLTFYSIFKRSRWRYVLASITAMMRYEGAVLILAAFVMDIVHSTNRRERIRAFAYWAMAPGQDLPRTEI